MTDLPDVDVETICAAFGELRCADLAEFYQVRDRLAAVVSLEVADDQSLLDLQTLLRAGYGVALANDLPTAAITSYAQLWRRKLAALAFLNDAQGDLSGSSTAPSGAAEAASGLTFHVHRYSRSFLLDALAAAWALPTNLQRSAAEFPLGSPSGVVRDKRDRFLQRNPVLLAEPRSQADRLSLPPAMTVGPTLRPVSAVDQAVFDASFRESLVKARKASKPFVRLPPRMRQVLDSDPFFGANPELFKDNTLDIDRTVAALQGQPQIEPGPAQEFQKVYRVTVAPHLAERGTKKSRNTGPSGP